MSEVSLQDSRFLREYLEVFRDYLGERGRYAALSRILRIFVEASGFNSLDEAIQYFQDSKKNRLHVFLQKTVNELQAQGLASKSIWFYMSLLANFLRFFDIDVDAARKKVRLPKKSTIRVERVPTLSELQRLILASKSPRMRLLIHLLAVTGLRLNEARLLKVDNIDFQNKVLRVPGNITKSGKSREIPLVPEIIDAIKNYLKKRKVDSPWLFPSHSDPSKPVNRYRIYDNFHNLLKRLGLDKRDSSGTGYEIHPHSLRKWFKTTLEKAGVNRLLIEMWLGHDTGIQGVYFLPPPETVEKEWKKAEKALKIFGVIEKEKQFEEQQELMESRIAELEETLKILASLFGIKIETSLYNIDHSGAKIIKWICKECGKEVIGDFANCPYCGARRLSPEIEKLLKLKESTKKSKRKRFRSKQWIH